MEINVKLVVDGETKIDGELKGFFGVFVTNEEFHVNQVGSINALEQMEVVQQLRKMADRMENAVIEKGLDLETVKSVKELMDLIGNHE